MDKREADRLYREAHRERLREYAREHYKSYKDRKKAVRKKPDPATVREANRAYKDRMREKVAEIKEGIGCLNPSCEWSGHYPACILDFHHIDPATKKGNVSQFLSQPTALYAEIAKCTVLCSNCHRLVTHGKLDGSKLPACEIPPTGIDKPC